MIDVSIKKPPVELTAHNMETNDGKMVCISILHKSEQSGTTFVTLTRDEAIKFARCIRILAQTL